MTGVRNARHSNVGNGVAAALKCESNITADEGLSEATMKVRRMNAGRADWPGASKFLVVAADAMLAVSDCSARMVYTLGDEVCSCKVCLVQ